MLIFEIIAGPRIRIASSRKVGGYRTVFNANARYDGWNRVEGKLASSAEELRFYVEKPSLGDRL